MSKQSWEIIKGNKNFNVHVYRRGLTALIASLGLSCLLGVLLFYMYVSEPPRDYYATNGMTPPIMLTALSAPNGSPQALLPPDPPVESEGRIIPQ